MGLRDFLIVSLCVCMVKNKVKHQSDELKIGYFYSKHLKNWQLFRTVCPNISLH